MKKEENSNNKDTGKSVTRGHRSRGKKRNKIYHKIQDIEVKETDMIQWQHL